MPAIVEPEASTGVESAQSPFTKISDALREYREACELSDTPPFHELVAALIDRGYDQDFKNDSFFDALCLTHTMLLTSLTSVKILTGSGGNFWSALDRPFAAAAENLRKTGGKIQMIVINATPDCAKALASMKSRFGEVFEYVLAKSASNISHFIVCDSRMIRIEEPHPPIDLDSSADVIKAKVNFRAPLIAKQQEKLFDSVWGRLQSSELPA
ncbi:hypothetical protein DB345_12380 [Spartobacteria bacterium LR76]|nr:hypothetical protein DB345_12380 [Spartobacteria bacterium LR76]